MEKINLLVLFIDSQGKCLSFIFVKSGIFLVLFNIIFQIMNHILIVFFNLFEFFQ